MCRIKVLINYQLCYYLFYTAQTSDIFFHLERKTWLETQTTCGNLGGRLLNTNDDLMCYTEDINLPSTGISVWLGNYQKTDSWILNEGCFGIEPVIQKDILKASTVGECYTKCVASGYKTVNKIRFYIDQCLCVHDRFTLEKLGENCFSVENPQRFTVWTIFDSATFNGTGDCIAFRWQNELPITFASDCKAHKKTVCNNYKIGPNVNWEEGNRFCVVNGGLLLTKASLVTNVETHNTDEYWTGIYRLYVNDFAGAGEVMFPSNLINCQLMICYHKNSPPQRHDVTNACDNTSDGYICIRDQVLTTEEVTDISSIEPLNTNTIIEQSSTRVNTPFSYELLQSKDTVTIETTLATTVFDQDTSGGSTDMEMSSNTQVVTYDRIKMTSITHEVTDDGKTILSSKTKTTNDEKETTHKFTDDGTAMSSSTTKVTENPIVSSSNLQQLTGDGTARASSTSVIEDRTDISSTTQRVIDYHTKISFSATKVTKNPIEVKSSSPKVTVHNIEILTSTQKITDDRTVYHSTAGIIEEPSKSSDVGLIGGLSAAGLIIIIVVIALVLNLRKIKPCQKTKQDIRMKDLDGVSSSIYQSENLNFKKLHSVQNTVYDIDNEINDDVFSQHNTTNNTYAVVRKDKLKSQIETFDDDDERCDYEDGNKKRLNITANLTGRRSENFYHTTLGYSQDVGPINNISLGYRNNVEATTDYNSRYHDDIESTYSRSNRYRKDYNYIDSTYDHMTNLKKE